MLRTNLLPEFTNEAWVSIGALKQAHGELHPKNPVDSIIDSAHGDNVVLYLVCQIINEFSVGKRNHDLQNSVYQSMVRMEENAFWEQTFNGVLFPRVISYGVICWYVQAESAQAREAQRFQQHKTYLNR